MLLAVLLALGTVAFGLYLYEVGYRLVIRNLSVWDALTLEGPLRGTARIFNRLLGRGQRPGSG